ncbi:class I SAM-dependent methyltransferase [Labilibacter marinus]|uniref:class I SAM-dependent methyltransferase n=1 Tax=Labilibacter marinus TaxID=1477105 RepID=UPI0008332203|nr:class I SAM-dependent methyltransferase [Labilibacter marinus]
MQQFWDERFSSETYLYGESPNPQFKNFLDSNTPGKILLPGEGEGRNAVYAAMQNWSVSAIDQSLVGKEKALSLASKNKVKIDYHIGDLLKHPYKTEQFDAIALVFLHLPKELRFNIHQQLTSLLKTGAKLLIVGFSEDQLKYNSGGPKDIEMLYSTDKLQSDFKDLQIDRNENVMANLEEGIGHKGQASLIVFEATKK